MFRAAAHSLPLEFELQRRNVPFKKYGGLKFIEAAHIKDLSRSSGSSRTPRDELAWFRALQLFPGIGPKTARRLLVLTGVNPPDGDRRTPITNSLQCGFGLRTRTRSRHAPAVRGRPDRVLR